MILLLIFCAFVCYGLERPDTPIPSSHRYGHMRVFTPTPPDSPATPPASPRTPRVMPTYPKYDSDKPEWERNCLEDWGRTRERSTPVRDDDYKRMDDSRASTHRSSSASTHMSSDDEETAEGDEIPVERGETVVEDGVAVTAVTWKKVPYTPLWFRALIDKIRTPSKSK